MLLWRVCSRGSAQKLDEASGCMYLAARCKISQRLKSAELWPPTLRHGASSSSHFTVLLSTDSLTACMVAQKPKTHLLPALCFWAAAAPQRGRRAARVTEAFQDCKNKEYQTCSLFYCGGGHNPGWWEMFVIACFTLFHLKLCSTDCEIFV